MAKAANTDPAAAIVDAAMTLFAERGYAGSRLADIATAAGVDLGSLRAIAGDKPGLLRLALQRADAAVLAEDAGFSIEESVRDRLFDLLMRRLDALAPYRAALRAAGIEMRRDPTALLSLALGEACAMGWYLEAAGDSADGPLGVLRVKGLGVVWLRAVRIWFDDDSDDFAKTMAALDKDLSYAERAAGWVAGRGATQRGESATTEDPSAP